MYKDPVCGMNVEHEHYSIEIESKKYYFCSNGCLNKFKDSPLEYSKKSTYDLIIIGGGPAGLTAAVYASISKLNTFLITNDIGGQAIDSSKVKNYMGFEFITGKELAEKFRDQFLEEHYLEHKMGEVIKINQIGDKFEIITKDREKYESQTLIIATGMKKRKMGIPGEDRLVRKGVSYSSVQDISLFKGLDVVVIGGGNSGAQTAEDLSKTGCNVSLITKGKMIADQKNIDKIKKYNNIKIYEGYNITEIYGEDSVEGVIIQSEDTMATTKLPCKGVFIQVGFLPNTEYCKDLVNLNRAGEIIINPDCSTNKPGIFACGDVTNAFGKRIIIASGEGAKAVLSAKKYLLDKKK
ncbi:MAG: FAD-dependent oxidoreductase [Chlorobi bacterium]|nr:FAD-dependent oxidoreductase [Chlorobiota bacterium]